jgi:4'-phosphopantetheinyl transferase
MNVLEKLIQLGCVNYLTDYILLGNLKNCPVDDSFWESYISTYDKERLRGIRCEKSRRRVLLRLALVRIILGDYLNFSPDKIHFNKNKYGKPSVINPVVKCNFNISHSGDDVILIFDRDRAVGIDIENFRSFNKRDLSILEGVYSAGELKRYRALAKQDQFEFFCSTWVVKEAILKALGIGITIELNSLDLPMFETNKMIKAPLIIGRHNMHIKFISHTDKYIGIAYCEE